MTGLGDEATGEVLSIGEILVDLITLDGESGLLDVTSLAVRPGGAPANVAVALAAQGVPVAFCGVVGDDPFGDRLIETLHGKSVDVTGVRRARGEHTTLALAWQDQAGDGHFRILRMADALLSPEDVNRSGISSRSAIVVGSVSLSAQPSQIAIHHAVNLASKHDVTICFDINVRPTLWSSDTECRTACEPVLESSSMIKASLDDVAFLAGSRLDPVAAIQWLAQYPADFLVLTDGSRGCWYLMRSADNDAANTVHLPAFPVDAIEPTGAGDAFTAALIHRLIANDWRSLDRIDFEFASAAGALTTTRPGAIDSMPSCAEIESFLNTQR